MKPTTRRAFLKIALGSIGTVALGPVYATQIEPRWLEVVRLVISIPHLPLALDGLTVVQLSDFHLGPYVSVEQVRRSVALANALHPDLTVLTGDFVYRSADYSSACAQELTALWAPLGVYAVLGNHDVWTGADVVAGDLEQAGIAALRDQQRVLTVEGDHLWLIGIEDSGITGMSGLFPGSISPGDFQQLHREKAQALGAMLEETSSGDCRLLLVHNPDFVGLLAEGQVDLVLSGHTHGGQVCLPGLGALFVPSVYGRRFVAGLVEVAGIKVYINRGIGLIAPPLRFLARPEVTAITLRRAARP
jgi:predicted MPP superfamily phosphohydrolase